jgi:hypothetical protein
MRMSPSTAYEMKLIITTGTASTENVIHHNLRPTALGI